MRFPAARGASAKHPKPLWERLSGANGPPIPTKGRKTLYEVQRLRYSLGKRTRPQTRGQNHAFSSPSNRHDVRSPGQRTRRNRPIEVVNRRASEWNLQTRWRRQAPLEHEYPTRSGSVQGAGSEDDRGISKARSRCPRRRHYVDKITGNRSGRDLQIVQRFKRGSRQ